MSVTDVWICRLCAEPKQESEVVDLSTSLYERCEIIANLSIFSIKAVDFSNKELPETVCSGCRTALRVSYEFLAKIKKSQDVLGNIFIKEIQSVQVKKENAVTSGSSGNHANSYHSERSQISIEIIPEIISMNDEPKKDSCYCKEPEPNSTKVKREIVSESDDDDMPLSYKCADTNIKCEKVKHSHACEFGTLQIIGAEGQITQKRLAGLPPALKKEYVQQKQVAELHRILLPDAPPRKRRMLQRNRQRATANQLTGSSKNIIYRYAWNNKKEPAEVKPRKKRKKATIEDLTCDICFKVFNVPAKLKYHKVIHRADRPKNYICDICGNAYYARPTLLAHKIIHNPANQRTCEICKKTFSSFLRLRKHLISHETIKRFKCDECPRLFRTKRQMQNHMIIHKDEFPYVCKYCDKRFKRKVNFDNHLNVHTGQRPFVCPECGRGFTNWSNCHKHRKRKHGKGNLTNMGSMDRFEASD